MHAPRNPGQAYRRIEFDARVAGADPRDLVLICYEQLGEALGRALAAAAAGNNRAKSEALTRALSALTALQIGVDAQSAIALALNDFYAAGRSAVLGSVLNFNPAALNRLRGDVADIAAAMAANELTT